MKKYLLILAASAFVASCNKLTEGEYEIAGTVDPSMNGKDVILEKQGGMMGAAPVDTVKVENGKFSFKGNATEPSLHFIQVEGVQGKAEFILEEGMIEIAVDKDSVFKSTRGGTFNNDKLTEYIGTMKATRKKGMDFQKKNMQAYMEAQQKMDTATANRLNREYEQIGKEMEGVANAFIDKNPKAYITLLLLKQNFMRGSMTYEEMKKKWDAIDASLKKTKDGKEVAEIVENARKQVEIKANVSEGKPAPDFTATTPDGKKVSLKQSMGKVTIIDFWASWCKPCRIENPNVVALYNEMHAQGLNIIGVSLDKEADKWKEAIAADKLTWTHVSNLKFWEEPIAAQYGVKSIPATFILDANGIIVAKDLRGDALKAKVKELLAAE